MWTLQNVAAISCWRIALPDLCRDRRRQRSNDGHKFLFEILMNRFRDDGGARFPPPLRLGFSGLLSRPSLFGHHPGEDILKIFQKLVGGR